MSELQTLRKFQQFADTEKELLEPIAGDLVAKRFERGAVLWRQGQDAKSFTFLVSGHVKIVKRAPDGNETILGLFHPGDAVGTVAVQQSIPYPATAIALTDVHLLSLPRNRLIAVMEAHPPLMRRIVGDLTRHARDLVVRIGELTLAGAEQRLAATFVNLARQLGEEPTERPAEVRIDLVLSRQELADLVNVRVETAIRIMSRWNKEGPVRTHTEGFVIEDLAALEQIAAGDP